MKRFFWNKKKSLFINTLSAIMIGGGFVMCLSLTGCKPSSTGKTDPPPTTFTFSLPTIPDILTDPTDRANYLANHYWDRFPFADTILATEPNTEQLFVDYIDILTYASTGQAEQSIRNMLAHTQKEESGRTWRHFLSLFEKYLDDPNSPYRNETLYIPVVMSILSRSNLDEAERDRTREQLSMMMKNRPEYLATDFVYTLANGKTGQLYDIQADFLILLFYNPDCHNCAETVTALKTSPVIRELLAKKTLAILAFYPDQDMDSWKKHRSDIPSNWINGYDAETKVKNDGLYELRAIPTLYLLNKEKRVLLKDANFTQLENLLRYPEHINDSVQKAN